MSASLFSPIYLDYYLEYSIQLQMEVEELIHKAILSVSKYELRNWAAR